MDMDMYNHIKICGGGKHTGGLCPPRGIYIYIYIYILCSVGANFQLCQTSGSPLARLCHGHGR